MKWWIVLLAFVAGMAVGIVYQKQMHTPIHIRVGDVSQQALLNPYPGDVIQWVDHYGAPMTPPLPNFDFVSPCDPKYKDDCHVLASANRLTYSYKCPTAWSCDPEVPVGSDVVGQKGYTLTLAAGGPTPARASIGCDPANGDQAGVTPPNVSVDVSAQGAVYWKGIHTATRWTVAVPAGLCKEPAIDETNNLCTLMDGVEAKPYTYTVTVTAQDVPQACKTPVTATLTVVK